MAAPRTELPHVHNAISAELSPSWKLRRVLLIN